MLVLAQQEPILKAIIKICIDIYIFERRVEYPKSKGLQYIYKVVVIFDSDFLMIVTVHHLRFRELMFKYFF